MGNIALDTPNARREILKKQVFTVLADLLVIPAIDQDSNSIDVVAWFLEIVTKKFDESQFEQVDKAEIVPIIVTKMLYSQKKETYVNGLSVLVQLTDVHSEKGGDIIIRYDESCNQQSG